MLRDDFIKIIKLRSIWSINKVKGNYKLPNGEKLSSYIKRLILSQMKIDDFGIRNNGDLCLAIFHGDNDEWQLIHRGTDEYCSADEMDIRINEMIAEMLGCSIISIR